MKDSDFSQRSSCEHMRSLFNALLHKELDAERSEQVKGHMLRCKSCAVAFSAAIDRAIARGELAVEGAPPMPRTYDHTIYGEKAEPLSFLKKVVAAIKRFPLMYKVPVPVFALMGIALVLIPSFYYYKELTMVKQRLQAALGEKENIAARSQQNEALSQSYKTKIEELERQITQAKHHPETSPNQPNEKLIKQYQAQIEELKKELQRPRLAQQTRPLPPRLPGDRPGERELQLPRIATAIYESISPGRQRGGIDEKTLTLEFTAERKAIVLVLRLPPSAGYKTYEVDISDKDEKTILWKSGAQPALLPEGDVFSLLLSKGFLTQEEYWLRVYGTIQEKKLIARYLLHAITR